MSGYTTVYVYLICDENLMPAIYLYVSSAKSVSLMPISLFILVSISLTYINDNSSPKMEPCIGLFFLLTVFVGFHQLLQPYNQFLSTVSCFL